MWKRLPSAVAGLINVSGARVHVAVDATTAREEEPRRQLRWGRKEEPWRQLRVWRRRIDVGGESAAVKKIVLVVLVISLTC